MNQTVLDGSLLVALPIAVLAGLVSFASPCVLPLVPGYLGYVTGLSGTDLEREKRGRMLAGVALFVAGFSAVFVVAGFLAGAVGEALVAQREGLTRVLGAVVIVLGLLFAGLLPRWEGTLRPGVRPAAGLVGAPLLGVVFGLGWAPCTGPTLAAIVSLSADFADPQRGAVLAAAYCAGLGVPFLLAALAYRRAMAAFDVLRRHRVAITRAGGLLLVGIGVMLLTGLWSRLMVSALGLISGFETAI